MSDIHVLKNTNSEVVLKCYDNNATGATLDITLSGSYITLPTEVYSSVCTLNIRAMYWGIKQNKQLDLMRIESYGPDVLDGHYYLSGTGFYEYKSFVDSAYGTKDIRIVSDGPFHLMLVLAKTGWKQPTL